jgi:ABC-type dipeptide/oligopeptide/nickel transport system permease subunit
MIYGLRLSILIGSAPSSCRRSSGSRGPVAGYIGGASTPCLMRIADIQLSFPT